MTRKTVQIATMPETAKYYPAVYALCDDGTLWRNAPADGAWRLMSAIPQVPACQAPKAAGD